MTPALLLAFHRVATTGSFSVAARTHGLSQPTLSTQVKQLEQRYGVALFERVGRGVRLTAVGQNLLPITSRMIGAMDAAAELLGATSAATRGHLRVGADSAYHAIPLLAAVRRLHPGLVFTLRAGNSETLLEQVLAYETDVAVLAKAVSDPRLSSRPLKRDRLVMFVPPGHPIASSGPISLAELAGRDLVLRERGSITREAFESALARTGVRPGALFEVESREGVREAVDAGFGIGVVFESEFGRDGRFVQVEVAGDALEVGEYVVCLEERRRLPLVRAFLDAAERAAQDQN